MHEDGLQLRHDELVVEPAHGSHDRRENDADDPDVVREVHPFAPARAAQQEERDERQQHAGPLVAVEPLAEEEHRPDEHHHGARGVDRADDGDRQVFDAEVAEDPRREDDEGLEKDQSVVAERPRGDFEEGAVEPAERPRGGEDHRQEQQRREKGVEQQHRQHGVVGERLFLGGVVKPQQGRRCEGERQPHGIYSIRSL